MLDPVLLESFLAVSQARSFSEAGRRLGVRQSTVSQHIRKLEDAAGRRLFVRDTHSVVPTADGEAMEGFARSILEANERASRYFAGSQLRGRVRFGASEVDDRLRRRGRRCPARPQPHGHAVRRSRIDHHMHPAAGFRSALCRIHGLMLAVHDAAMKGILHVAAA